MKQLLEHIVSALIDHPDDVRVDVSENESSINATIQAHTQDVGRLIGRKGKTINAIRMWAKLLAVKSGKKLSLTIS